ncbi:unnamed protein product [Urochloa humidicola]
MMEELRAGQIYLLLPAGTSRRGLSYDEVAALARAIHRALQGRRQRIRGRREAARRGIGRAAGAEAGGRRGITESRGERRRQEDGVGTGECGSGNCREVLWLRWCW